MSFIRTLFPSLCHQPQVGETYVHVAQLDDYNPFYPLEVFVISEVRGTYVRMQNVAHVGISNLSRTLSIKELICFYRPYDPS
jgi:hypothetical protein